MLIVFHEMGPMNGCAQQKEQQKAEGKPISPPLRKDDSLQKLVEIDPAKHAQGWVSFFVYAGT